MPHRLDPLTPENIAPSSDQSYKQSGLTRQAFCAQHDGVTTIAFLGSHKIVMSLNESGAAPRKIYEIVILSIFTRS
jgi:hypothetical protein